MLSNTSEGLNGLKALYEAYCSHFGCGADELASKHDYTICPENGDLSLFGQLKHAEKEIVISASGPEVARNFTTFHEMAHHFLHGVAPVFNAAELPGDIADDIEYWCDHFAVAMVFARHNVRLMDEANHRQFLTFGNAAAYNGQDAISPWRQNKVLSQRLLKIASAHFKRKSDAYEECKTLSQALLDVSREMRTLNW